MCGSYDTRPIFEYVKRELGMHYLRWLELDFAGYAQDHRFSKVCWRKYKFIFDSDDEGERMSSLSNIREQISYQCRLWKTPFIQVTMRARLDLDGLVTQNTLPLSPMTDSPYADIMLLNSHGM